MTYLLIIQAQQPSWVQVGALKTRLFTPGYYLYIGSAKRGLKARIARHRRPDKKRRWHIDYLLSRPEFTVRAVWLSESMPECTLADTLRARPEMSIPQPGLGASDCRCPAHLLAYTGDLPLLHNLLKNLGLYLYCGSEGCL